MMRNKTRSRLLPSRRLFLGNIAAATLFASGSSFSNSTEKQSLLSFLALHRKQDGAYDWKPLSRSHVTPTFAVVGCYHLLHEEVPNANAVATFVRDRYPVAERRRTERPLWRLDFEQVQTLLWLNQSVDSFRWLAKTWSGPADFTRAYELDGFPVFQHQAMAVYVRYLLGLAPAESDEQWRIYFRQRRRSNQTFNNTPASDGSEGHIVNTVWGVWAQKSLGEKPVYSPQLIDWIHKCQLPSGGFTYMPDASIGAVDDILYTWSAVFLLSKAHAPLPNLAKCIQWLCALRQADGGFCDRPGGFSNPTATFYALDTLRMLRQTIPAYSANSFSRSQRRLRSIPAGSRIFTIQIEAPGAGSPHEAVALAKTLGIHIWAAKNTQPGWISEAQRIANAEKAPVLFAAGNEEYGTYVSLPGLGTYSHLDDLVAPPDHDFGPQLPRKRFPYRWETFRDIRIRALKRGKGRMIWQFNENEELTRVLLDEAPERGTYAAISSFHFGNENFLDSQPFLMRWYGLLPMIALQDAHGAEPWWWGDFLCGFRTLFVAKEPTWEAWLQALERQHVLAVRKDGVTGGQLQFGGGLPFVQQFAMDHQDQWCWWGKSGETRQRPAAVMTILSPGMRFETHAPHTGKSIRIRLWSDNTGHAKPMQPRAELVSVRIDGTSVHSRLIATDTDRYYIYESIPEGAQVASAVVRVLATGEEITLRASLTAPGI